jgi:hypothetical protein
VLTLAFCVPPPNLFAVISADPSVAVWRISLACSVLLGAETLLLLRHPHTLHTALPPLIGALGCLALAVAAWIQSRTFIQVVCATSLHYDLEAYRRVMERAQAAARLNMIYQDLAVAACVVTLILLVWGAFHLIWLSRKPRVV